MRFQFALEQLTNNGNSEGIIYQNQKEDKKKELGGLGRMTSDVINRGPSFQIFMGKKFCVQLSVLKSLLDFVNHSASNKEN